jgi:hypothetical protein
VVNSLRCSPGISCCRNHQDASSSTAALRCSEVEEENAGAGEPGAAPSAGPEACSCTGRTNRPLVNALQEYATAAQCPEHVHTLACCTSPARASSCCRVFLRHRSACMQSAGERPWARRLWQMRGWRGDHDAGRTFFLSPSLASSATWSSFNAWRELAALVLVVRAPRKGSTHEPANRLRCNLPAHLSILVLSDVHVRQDALDFAHLHAATSQQISAASAQLCSGSPSSPLLGACPAHPSPLTAPQTLLEARRLG